MGDDHELQSRYCPRIHRHSPPALVTCSNTSVPLPLPSPPPLLPLGPSVPFPLPSRSVPRSLSPPGLSLSLRAGTSLDLIVFELLWSDGTKTAPQVPPK